MTLSVIIVSYNVKAYVEQCLLALERSLEGIESEVFVVDNHSRDGSADYLQERFPSVSVVASNHNLGFARANNLALRQARGEYALLLNPDTIVAEDTLRQTLDFMDAHPQAGSCGCRMLQTDGQPARESRRGLPSPWVAFCKMTGLTARFPRSRRFGRYYMGWLPWDQPAQIEAVSGAFCLLRRTALDRAGLLDEDFFMYGEDIDLSYRLLKDGLQNYYLPTPIIHYKGESTVHNSYRYVHVFYEAMLIFYKKHFCRRLTLVSLPIQLAIILRAVLDLLLRQRHYFLRFLHPHRKRRTGRMLYLGHAAAMMREIAESYAFDADCIEADAQTMPDGHLTEGLDLAPYRWIVYDTADYTYTQMLHLFSQRPVARLNIGTLHSERGILITENKVFHHVL